MVRAVVVHVPVHGERAPAEELDTVHADVVAGGLGIVGVGSVDGVDAGEGDVAASVARVPLWAGAEARDSVVDGGGIADCGEVPIERPAADDREGCQVDLVAGEDEFLAWPVAA